MKKVVDLNKLAKYLGVPVEEVRNAVASQLVNEEDGSTASNRVRRI